MSLQQHPLSAAFPAMPEADIESLAEDIKKHGLREPGVLFEEKVLDGWHRYVACERVGVPFKSTELNGEDPVAFVLSHNLHRRHLTASQRAGAIVAATNWRPHGDQSSRSVAATDRTAKSLAEQAEVSVATIEKAKTAERAGLGKAVRDGAVSVERAAKIARLPKAQQAKALKEPKPPKEKKAPADVAKLKARVEELHGALAETKDALAEMKELAQSAKAFEEKQEFKEMQVLRLELRSCKRRRDELMRENAEQKKQISFWKKKAEKK